MFAFVVIAPVAVTETDLCRRPVAHSFVCAVSRSVEYLFYKNSYLQSSWTLSDLYLSAVTPSHPVKYCLFFSFTLIAFVLWVNS